MKKISFITRVIAIFSAIFLLVPSIAFASGNEPTITEETEAIVTNAAGAAPTYWVWGHSMGGGESVVEYNSPTAVTLSITIGNATPMTMLVIGAGVVRYIPTPANSFCQAVLGVASGGYATQLAYSSWNG